MENSNNNKDDKNHKNGRQGMMIIILTTLITAFLVLGLYPGCPGQSVHRDYIQ